MGSRRNNDPKNDQACTQYSHVSTSHEIRKGSNERADCRQSKQVGEDEPRPSVCTTNIPVDQGRDTAEEVNGDLGACPEECHGNQGHESLEGQLDRTVNNALDESEGSRRTGGSWSWSLSSPYVRSPPFS
jgi:hypothetical protein